MKHTPHDTTRGAPDLARVPKLCGADIELGNFILGAPNPATSNRTAARVLLAQFEGVPLRRTPGLYGDSSGDTAQDWGRKFLPANGGCAYIDLDHLELCIPEVVSAYDHVACWHAMLRIAQAALESANREQPESEPIQVLVNNSDERVSYGSHLNFLVTRRTWDNLFSRRLHHALHLAAYQASSIVFTGQGKTGSQNGAPWVPFQISQRADWFETLIGPQTTFQRPLVNARDEPLCGPSQSSSAGDLARLHVIFFDNTLCHVSSLLKVGVMQMILTMIEADCVRTDLILEDPLEAVRRWSHDPDLGREAPLADGRSTTAVELQRRFCEDAMQFHETGGFDGSVPRAGEILALWADTLGLLEARDFDRLARRLDWVLKRQILERARALDPAMDWGGPELLHLDYLYSSLKRDEGLYWAYEHRGMLDTVVQAETIDHFVHSPPAETRAWSRAMLLRRIYPPDVDQVDWDRVRVRTGQGSWWRVRTVDFEDPLGHARNGTEHIFERSESLDELLDRLASVRTRGEAGSDVH